MRNLIKFFPISCLAVFCFITQAMAAQTIVNGSFESATHHPYKTHMKLHPGREIVYGWQVFRSVDYVGRLWEHARGDYSIDLNGSSAGSIGQIIETTPNYSYSVQFEVSANANCGSEPRYLNVKAGTNEVNYTILLENVSNSEMHWKTKTFAFRAKGDQTLLLFTSMSPGFCGVTLDHVRFTPIAQVPSIQRGEWALDLKYDDVSCR